MESDYLKRMASIHEMPQELLKNRYSARDSVKLKKKKVDISQLRAVKPMHNQYVKDRFRSIGERLEAKVRPGKTVTP